MVQGSTPTHVFELPIEGSKISKLRITYVQNCSIILEKSESEVSIQDASITVKLTQQETFRFLAGYTIYIQLKVLLVDGTVLVSQIIQSSIEQALNGEILA